MKLKYCKLYEKCINEYAEFSTCARLHVAAMLVKDGRILSVGYNGVAHGKCHCNEIFIKDKASEEGEYFIKNPLTGEMRPYDYDTWSSKHHEYSIRHEFHAEMNCIAFATKNNINISECDMVLNISPCINCAKMIYLTGIKNVYYLEEYDRDKSGIEFLKEHGVNVGLLETKT